MNDRNDYRDNRAEHPAGRGEVHAPVRRVVAIGRRKTAGWLVCGGGLGVALSAFLPWFTVIGLVNAGLGGAGILVAALGAGLAFLGARILMERTSRKTTIILWVLAALDLLIVIGLFSSKRSLDGTGGLVTPAMGFYLALLGLIATVAGTVVMQTTVRPGAGDPEAHASDPPFGGAPSRTA